jgi:hypothetical protein
MYMKVGRSCIFFADKMNAEIAVVKQRLENSVFFLTFESLLFKLSKVAPSGRHD